MNKAVELPLGTVVELSLDHEDFPGLTIVKESDFISGGTVWGVLGRGLTHSYSTIEFTDEEVDQLDYTIKRIPEGYKIEDYDQSVKFLNAVRRLDTGDFNLLLGFLEKLGE